MRHKGIDAEQIRTLKATGLSQRAIARQLNVDPATIRWHLSRSGAQPTRSIFDGEVSIPLEVTSERPVEVIIKDLDAHHERKQEFVDATTFIPVEFHEDKPIALAVIGDTHVDDPGSNRKLLTEHLELVNDTPGMYACHIGDVGNSWGTKLRHLYAEQTTTARETVRLVEHYIKMCRKWLFIVEGNHDRWAAEYDPIRGFMPELSSRIYQTTCSLNLTFPNGAECGVFAKHNLKGHSMWNVVHGAGKTAAMGIRYNIILSGHTHVAGINIRKDPDRRSGLDGGMHMHCLQVGTYKNIDKYAETGDFHDHNITPCWTCVINPHARGEVDFVTSLPSIHNAAKLLGAMR